MKKLILVIIIAFSFSSCFQDKELHLQFDDPDTFFIEKTELPNLEIHKDIYVPAYSNLYYESDVRKTYFTVILSLRNISFIDSIYFDRIEYYDSEGKLLKEFIKNILVLRPMESIEFIVESSDKKGGPGANFVVSYSGRSNLKNPHYIEAVMLGNIDGYGFSFSSPGIEINK
jgi:hypothetical protein